MERAITSAQTLTAEELTDDQVGLGVNSSGQQGLDEANTQYDLPPAYDENTIVAMARDPYCIYFYWELTEETHSMTKDFLQCENQQLHYIARIYDVLDPIEGWKLIKSIKLAPFSGNWYVHEVDPKGKYIVDVGFFAEDNFITLLRSNPIITPPDQPDNASLDQKSPSLVTITNVSPSSKKTANAPSSSSVYQK